MKKYTIMIDGVIFGTYEGTDEDDAYAKLQAEQPAGAPALPKLSTGKVKITEAA